MKNSTLLIIVVILAAAGIIYALTTKKNGSKQPNSDASGIGKQGTPVNIETNQIDCASVSGRSGTLKIDGQEFYCSGTFQCTPDGKITCQNPQYYYYPYYYYYRPFPFFRRFPWGGHGIGGPGGPGSGTGGGTGPGTGGGGGPH